MMLATETPTGLRVELAAAAAGTTTCSRPDLLDRLTNMDQPAPIRLFAAELMLRSDPHDPDGSMYSAAWRAQPNRELAVQIGGILQNVLGLDLGCRREILPRRRARRRRTWPGRCWPGRTASGRSRTARGRGARCRASPASGRRRLLRRPRPQRLRRPPPRQLGGVLQPVFVGRVESPRPDAAGPAADDRKQRQNKNPTCHDRLKRLNPLAEAGRFAVRGFGLLLTPGSSLLDQFQGKHDLTPLLPASVGLA